MGYSPQDCKESDMTERLPFLPPFLHSFLPSSLPFFLPSFFLSEGMVGDMCGRSLKVIEFILHADKTLKENENGDFKRNFWASYRLPEIADSSTEIDL